MDIIPSTCGPLTVSILEIVGSLREYGWEGVYKSPGISPSKLSLYYPTIQQQQPLHHLAIPINQKSHSLAINSSTMKYSSPFSRPPSWPLLNSSSTTPVVRTPVFSETPKSRAKIWAVRSSTGKPETPPSSSRRTIRPIESPHCDPHFRHAEVKTIAKSDNKAKADKTYYIGYNSRISAAHEPLVIFRWYV